MLSLPARYESLEVLGVGSLSDVLILRVHDGLAGTERVLKCLRRANGDGDLLLREFALLGSLTHPSCPLNCPSDPLLELSVRPSLGPMEQHHLAVAKAKPIGGGGCGPKPVGG